MKKILLLTFLIVISAQANKIEEGKALYTEHGCYGCHGSDAKGGLTFPRLANKPKSYLVKRLKIYRSGYISSNRADIMKPYAKDLTDEQIDAIAEFLNKMPKKKPERFEQEYETGTSAGS